MALSKVVLIGDTKVGKTSLYHRITKNEFSDSHAPTVQGSYAAVDVQSKSGVLSKIALWDTAGQERYKTVVPMYFHEAQFVLLTYSITSRESFDALPSWIELASQTAKSDSRTIVIGNMADLETDRTVAYGTASGFAKEIGAYLYVETSARNGSGIDILLSALGDACLVHAQPATQTLAGAGAELEPGQPPQEPSTCC
jgi:small GTP-binding protein